MNPLNHTWAAATALWEARHPDWDIIVGQPVPLGSQDAAAEDHGFMVIARQHLANLEREGVGADVSSALDDLSRQIQRSPSSPVTR